MILADEIVALASIPAPTGAEDARIAWIERRIAHLPGARSRDAAGNLIWRFSPDRRELLVMAHVDTAFDADTPVSILRDGDQLVGPARRQRGRLDSGHTALEAMPTSPRTWPSRSPSERRDWATSSGVHTPQERIELGSLELGVRQVGEVIRALLA